MTPQTISGHKSEDRENHRWFKNQCCANAEKIAADLDEIDALVRAKMVAWDADGWLERDVREWVNGPNGLERTHRHRLTTEQAVKRVTERVREQISEHLSLTAQEARDVSGVDL